MPPAEKIVYNKRKGGRVSVWVRNQELARVGIYSTNRLRFLTVATAVVDASFGSAAGATLFLLPLLHRLSFLSGVAVGSSHFACSFTRVKSEPVSRASSAAMYNTAGNAAAVVMPGV